MTTKPDCPFVSNCKKGKWYGKVKQDERGVASNPYPCGWRKRRTDGAFECANFEETELTTLDKLPDPTEELFPGHDYGRK